VNCILTLPSNRSVRRSDVCIVALALILVSAAPAAVMATPPSTEPVVARIEMKLADGEDVIDVIEKGDLLTVVEERQDDYVILTHDGTKGAVDKVNAVRIAESGDVYTELIQLNPQEGRFYTLRASSWWALGNTEKALADFDRAIELGYTKAHAYTSRGLFHAEMGRFKEAIADYNESLKIDPDGLAPIINRAAVYMNSGQFLKAAEDYTLVLEKNKDNISLLHQRAIALKAAGQMDEAIKDFGTILDSKPDDHAAIVGRGYIRFQQQDYKAAIVDFSRAIELNSQDPVAYNNRGYNRHQIGEFAGAMEDYDEAIRLAPSYALALQNRAWLLATAANNDLRDPAAAVESAKKACELSDYSEVGDVSALAAAFAAAGKFDEATGWQEKVVEMIGKPYKEYAEKTLLRYQNERPYAADPDQANAKDRADAEQAAKSQQQASSEIRAETEPKT
jgi:tetratricopeptide (TPR) repeat protein